MNENAAGIRKTVKLTALMLLSSLFIFTACFEDGGGDDPPETYNSSLFVSKSTIGPGAECASGGVRIDMGFDVNKNNVLDTDEVTNTEYVCHGADGEDASSHPFVVYTYPTSNELKVSRDTAVSIVFNTEMDTVTVDETTVTLKDELGNPVNGNVAYNDITAVFTPNNRLETNMKYTVTVSPTVENSNDIAMGYEHKVFFYTSDRYIVAYHSNGATGGTVPGTAYYTNGTSVKVQGNTGSLVKTGSPFMGWCTASNGSGTCYSGGEDITVGTADVDLYAHWGHSITFNKNDDDATGTMDPQIMSAGAKENLNACGFTKPGWGFAGWSTTPGGAVEYSEGAEFTMGAGNVVLYAKWFDNPFTPGQKVTVTADGVTFNMAYVPGGKTFPTGIDNSGTATVANAYWIGETEVTYELWFKIYIWATSGSGAPGAGQYSFVFTSGNEPRAGDDGTPGSETTSQKPVTYVNWRHTMVWCNALTEWYNANNGTATDLDCVYYTDSGYVTPRRSADDNPTFDGTAGSQDNSYVKVSAKGFRLLTSNEWELAARWRDDSTNTVSGYTNPYFTKGNSASGATTYYNDVTGDPNYAGKLANDAVAVYGSYWNGSSWVATGVTSTATVKSKGVSGANDLGLYDMSGNVWEWCFDLDGGSHRVKRGGSWYDFAYVMQVGCWTFFNPWDEHILMGFRFARTQ